MFPEMCVDTIDVVTVIKEMNASLHMLVKLKQVNPSLNNVTQELCVDGRQEVGVSWVINLVGIIFHRLNNLNELESGIRESEMETNEDHVGTMYFAEKVPIVTSHTCL